MSKNKKLKFYGILSIVSGIFVIVGFLFEKLFVWICFPGNYTGEGLISFSACLLIIAGIFILKRYKNPKILYRTYSIGLLIDALVRYLYFFDEFPLGIILGQILYGLIFILISFDKDLNFEKEQPKLKIKK